MQNFTHIPYHEGYQKILEYYRTLRARDLTESDILFLRRVGVINGCGGNPRNPRVGVFGRVFGWIAS